MKLWIYKSIRESKEQLGWKKTIRELEEKNEGYKGNFFASVNA